MKLDFDNGRGQMKNNIKREFLFTIITIFVMLVLMLTYTFYKFYHNSVERINEIGETNLQNESTQIENYLNKGMDVMWVTADTVEYMIRSGASNQEILDYLTVQAADEQAEIDENFTGIYGYIRGEYLDGIGWTPPSDYVPKEREWYTAAVEAGGEPTVVAPYLDAQTNTVMISVCQLLEDGESVISLDIILNEIQYITENISLDEKGYGFILDKTGLVVAHPNEDEKGKVYDENSEQAELAAMVFDVENGTFPIYLNGERCMVYTRTVMDDWHVVMIVSNTMLFKELRKQLIWDIIVCLLIFVVIDIFCFAVYRKIGEHQARDERSREQLDKMNTNIIRALAYTIDAKDRYTSGHSQRVANYSLELSRRMGKSEDEQRIIYYAGLLHDVGKIRVPEDVINKPGKLTDDEFNMIKMHPVSGYHILKDIYEDKRISSGAKYHHERYDGKGYPNGLSGDNIPEIARIIGVADAYDAMASNRSYRDALPQDVVRSEIEKGIGKQFDPEIGKLMLTMIDEDTDYKMCQQDTDKKKILVVDDESMNLKMVQHILKDEPYEVICASSAKEALELLEENEFDMVLLDLVMPDVKDFELCISIKENYTVPVVLMTADKNLDTMQKAAELGIEDYVTKPFLPVILRETVHSIVSSWK
jgi:putative nucleotidyltransferase with HDIG domain